MLTWNISWLCNFFTPAVYKWGYIRNTFSNLSLLSTKVRFALQSCSSKRNQLLDLISKINRLVSICSPQTQKSLNLCRTLGQNELNLKKKKTSEQSSCSVNFLLLWYFTSYQHVFKSIYIGGKGSQVSIFSYSS